MIDPQSLNPHWSATPPDKSGKYWVFGWYNEPFIVNVYGSGENLRAYGVGLDRSLSRCKGLLWWSEPISSPPLPAQNVNEGATP